MTPRRPEQVVQNGHEVERGDQQERLQADEKPTGALAKPEAEHVEHLRDQNQE